MNFAIGLSALRASQFAIDTVAHNIANAQTTGYHRQRVNFATRPPHWIGGHFIGSGADISRIDRMRNQVLESSFTNSLSDLSGVQQYLVSLRQIESEFLPGDGSLHHALSGFFSELTRLSSNPNEPVVRGSVVQQASQIAYHTHRMYHRLNDLKANVQSQVQNEVAELNQQIAELVELQNRIQIASAGNHFPNDLHDQRDQLINRIAQKIDIQRFEQTQGGFGLSIGGSAISIGVAPVAFQTRLKEDGALVIELAHSQREIKFQSGSLASLVEVHNTSIPRYQNKLDEFATRFMREVDQAHAKGVGVDGPFTVLRSSRKFTTATLPLNQAGLAFPVQQGQLFISVTDPSGEKRTHRIEILPGTESLDDVAKRISQIGNVQAIVDHVNGQLSIVAQSGYRFDFTGSTETIPDLASYTGTSTPRFSGTFQGAQNRELAVTMVGSGQVGKTPGLMARVTDVGTGLVIAEVPIGEGYEVGTPLPITEGIHLNFAAGTVVDGDSFTTHLVADADATGFLAALGLNSLFAGHHAGDMGVSARIAENPRLFAASRSGDVADTSNLMGMLRLRERPLVGPQNMTFQDYLNDTTAEIGFQVRSQQFLEQNVATVNRQYAQEIEALSGVDLNEELLGMVQFQKQYEASVQVLRTMDNMLVELMDMVR